MSEQCDQCGGPLSFRNHFVHGAQDVCGDCFSALRPDVRTMRPVVEPPADLGFNFGAGVLSPLWLLCHGKTLPGIGLMALGLVTRVLGALGPGGVFLGLIISVVQVVAVGSQANRIAWLDKRYASLDEMRRAQKPWLVAGLIVFSLMIVGNIAAFLS